MKRTQGLTLLRIAQRFCVRSALFICLSGTSEGAATVPFSSTSLITQVAVPGVWHTNSSGQVSFKGQCQYLQVVSTDSRMTGRRLTIAEGAYQADGTALIQGVSYQEVGTWNNADPVNPQFAANGGLWQINWHGVVQADNSMAITAVGFGSGASVNGARLTETLTRAAGDLNDVTIPCHHSGTMFSAPVSTRAVIGSFDTNGYGAWDIYAGQGILTNQHLTLTRDWKGVHTTDPNSTTVWATRTFYCGVARGRTLVMRANLISVSDTNSSPVIGVYSPNTRETQCYGLQKGANFLTLWKQNGNVFSPLMAAKAAIGSSNVILELSLTAADQDLIVSGKVLDNTDAENVLASITFVDTAAADAVLSAADLKALTGMELSGLGPDPPGEPWKNFQCPFIAAFQLTDGAQPVSAVTFDNVEIQTHELAQVSIEPAVRIAWPSCLGNCAIETSSSLNGPWLPVSPGSWPSVLQLTVPQTGTKQFFRLR